MKNPVLAFAGLAVTGVLVLAGCSSPADDSAASSSTTSESVQDASETSATAGATPVAVDDEVTYEDLDIKEMDTVVDADSAISVTLADGASTGDSGVSVDGNTVTLTAGGTYRVSGTLSAGSIVVDAPDEDVTVILDGVDVTAAGVGAFNVVSAKNVLVYLADGSQNSLSDAEGAAVDESDDDAPNAAMYSSADLWIAGPGALDVTGVNDGITSKDSLVITGGTISVTAEDDGVRGKDHLVIRDGSLTVDAGGDALKSDNEGKDDSPDAVVGVIWIEGGVIDLKAGSDAADAARQVTINGGDLTITAGDDGLHSDGVMRIDGGTIDIAESAEGIEGAFMYLSGGDVVVVASDDGINVSGGSSTSAAAEAGGEGAITGPDGSTGGQLPDRDDMPTDGVRPERPEGAPEMGEMPADGAQSAGMGAMGGSATATDDISTLTVSTFSAGGEMGGPSGGAETDRHLELTGGNFVVTSDGDGVDVNGNLTVSGGTLVVNGPEGNGNGAMDVDGTFTLNGGTVAASGSSGMAVAPDAGGEQASLNISFSAGVPAGTVIAISDSSGAHVASFTTKRISQSFVFSSDQIVAGDDYSVTVGGEVTGSSSGGLVVDGSASGGDDIGTVTAQ